MFQNIFKHINDLLYTNILISLWYNSDPSLAESAGYFFCTLHLPSYVCQLLLALNNVPAYKWCAMVAKIQLAATCDADYLKPCQQPPTS